MTSAINPDKIITGRQYAIESADAAAAAGAAAAASSSALITNRLAKNNISTRNICNLEFI